MFKYILNTDNIVNISYAVDALPCHVVQGRI